MAQERKLFTLEAEDFREVSGPLDFNLTNDYMFKATLQENTEALKGLIGALLRINPALLDIEVTNPILLGKSLENKDFYLDVKVLINGDKCINLEMQVENLGNWPERSLSYTTRAFDTLPKGESYENIMPIHHIGFVCFNVFKEHNILFDTFSLKNRDNSLIFTDKFMLSVVNLKQIDTASEEDKQYKLDKWCRFITATTWEEIQELAKEDPDMEATAETLFTLNTDFDARENAIRRKEYFDAINYKNKQINQLDKVLIQKNTEITNMNKTISDLDATIAVMDAEIADKDAAIADRDKIIEELRKQLERAQK